MNWKFIYIIIFYIIITISNTSFFFNFPYSISLSNGNILVIHKSGISICDYLLSDIIEDIIIFKEDEQIKTEESLSKVTTATIDEYIIILINDKIYIFNDTGNLLYESDKEYLEQGETAEYYSLVPIKKTGNDIFYFIGFIYNELLYFLYYKYNYEENKNFILSKRIGKHKDSYYNVELKIKNKGLSCQYMQDMINHQYYNPIVCFFLTFTNSYYYLTIDYFSIEDDNYIDYHPKYISDYFNISGIIKCIKSCVNQDHSKAILGLYLTTGECRYYIYNIQDFKIRYIYYKDVHCRDKYNELKINYYKEKEE